MALEDSIRHHIQHNGPMNIATFMGQVVSYYYNSRDPFGADGDFTTAPEVSQMFGELLGAWVADCWMQIGQPANFMLVECGPGRGTLMADALRATKQVPGFHEAAQIHLIEMSDVLKEKQKLAIEGFAVEWHDSLETLPEGVPLILLANEFLDALPIRQFQFADGQWQERVVGLNGSEKLHLGLAPALDGPSDFASEGDVKEVSQAVQSFVSDVCERLKKQGGTALFIDYGYTQGHGHGDTLQALKKHRFVDVLENIGEADLTAHVDFGALAVAEKGLGVFGPIEQGPFLQKLGISQRAAMLKQNANEKQGDDIDAALKRLTAPNEMGALFKVLAFASDNIHPAGF